MICIRTFSFLSSQRKIVIDHQLYELLKVYFRLPAQFTTSFTDIA
jgi:hypothetical protein